MSIPSDTIAIVPDRLGAAGRAWRVDLPSHPVLAVNAALLALWIVEAPAAHPFWHSYALSLIHLREAPGLPAPIIHRERASHELVIHALDPEHEREPMLGSAPVALLQPANFAAQLVEPSDDAARALVEYTVQLVVDGRLNPDTDARQQWIAIFGDAMVRGS